MAHNIHNEKLVEVCDLQFIQNVEYFGFVFTLKIQCNEIADSGDGHQCHDIVVSALVNI